MRDTQMMKSSQLTMSLAGLATWQRTTHLQRKAYFKQCMRPVGFMVAMRFFCVVCFSVSLEDIYAKDDELCKQCKSQLITAIDERDANHRLVREWDEWRIASLCEAVYSFLFSRGDISQRVELPIEQMSYGCHADTYVTEVIQPPVRAGDLPGTPLGVHGFTTAYRREGLKGRLPVDVRVLATQGIDSSVRSLKRRNDDMS